MADGRFAPTPSGDLHLGNLRTALLAWLFARSAGSRFVLRLEDLDPAADRPEVARRQVADLVALGIDWDGPPTSQRSHPERYRAAIDRLVQAGLTYPCYCTRREIQAASTAEHGPAPEGAYPGTCRGLDEAGRAARRAEGRRPALRLRAGGVVVRVVDRLVGPLEAEVDDLVLRRADGVVAYNLAVVVDDGADEVGEVVRGDDLRWSTPRQAHLAALLDLAVPSYAHLPLVLGPDGRRLAKRDGAVTLTDRRARGEEPEQVRSLLASSVGLGEPGEPVSMATLLDRFDPDRLPREAWRLDPTVLGT